MCRDFFFFFCFLSILCKPVWICWGFCLFFLILQFNSTCPPLPKKERKLINRTDWQTTLSSPRDMLCLRPCTPTQLCSVILSIAPLGLSCYVQTIEIRLNIHHTKIEETEDITLDIYLSDLAGWWSCPSPCIWHEVLIVKITQPVWVNQGWAETIITFNFSKPVLKQSDYADVLFGFTIRVTSRFLCVLFVTGFTWLSGFEAVYV